VLKFLTVAVAQRKYFSRRKTGNLFGHVRRTDIIITLYCVHLCAISPTRAHKNERCLITGSWERATDRGFSSALFSEIIILFGRFFSSFSYTVLSASSDRHFFPPLPSPPPTFRRFHIYINIYLLSAISVTRSGEQSRSRGRADEIFAQSKKCTQIT